MAFVSRDFDDRGATEVAVWGVSSMSGSNTHPPVLGPVARRLMVATALAGLGIAQSAGAAHAGSSDGVYTLGDSGSDCGGGSASCSLLSPTSVRVWGPMSFSGQPGTAMLLQGTGAAMTTNVVDISMPTMLAKSTPGSDRTTIDALLATYAAATGKTPQVDMPLSQLVTTATDGTVAKTDVLRAVSAWDGVLSVLGSNPTAITTVSAAANWVAARSDAQLRTTLQPELASLNWAADGTTSASAAQFAVAKVLFRSFTTSDITARNGSFLASLKQIATDGVVSLSAAKALMKFDQMPQAQQDYYAQSLTRVLSLLSGLEVSGGADPTYRVTDLVRATEADGSAYDVVYGNTQHTLSSATSVSLRSILNMQTLTNSTYAKNVSSLFVSAIGDYLTGVASGSTTQLGYANALLASNSLTLRGAGTVTVANGPGVVATNTGAIKLTSDIAITVSGTSIDALAAYDNGATGDVSVTNRGRVTISGSDVVGVKGKVSAGAGTVTVVNEGTVVLNGTDSAALRAKSVDGGAATATNAATGTVDVSGTGSSALYASATSAGATVSNAGTITVHDGATVGIVAYSDTGAFTTASNTGTISVTSSAASGAKAGAVVATGGTAAAKASNSGSVVVVGDRVPALLAKTTAANGTAEATNSGIISVTGAESAALVANATGTGAASATNSGAVTTGGSNAQAMIVWSVAGKASGSNTAGATIDVEGSGAWGLDVSSTTGEAAITNAGTVTVRNGFLGAVARSDSGAASVVNTGTVALETDGTMQTMVVVGTPAVGALVGSASTGSASVDNKGTVTAHGASTNGILTVTDGASATMSVSNSGTVTVEGANSAGVRSVSSGGDISIANLGTITTSGTGAVAVAARTPNGVIEVSNSGRIAGAVTVAAGTGSARLANSGLLDGSVSLAGASTTMTNSGTVTGTVTFGDGAGTFFLMSGASVGKVVAGVGDTLLDVRESAGRSRSLDAATYVGFKQASLSGNADWTLSGDFSSTGFTVGGGRALLDGTLGNTSLSAGTTLLGSGSMASLTAKGATVAVGDTFTTAGLGKITVGGDLTLGAASIVLLDVVKDKADLIEVKGTAHLDGTLLLRGADVVGGKTITIVDAKAVEQTFASTGWTEAGKWDFLKMEVVYGPTSVTVKTTDPVSTAKETLQGESKTFLNAVFGETPVLPTTEMQAAYQTIGTLISDAQGDAGKIQKTMDEVSGKATVAAANAGVVAVQAVDQAVSRASDAALGGGGGATGGGMTMAYFEDPAEAEPAQRAIGRVLYEKVPSIESRSLIAWTTGQFGFGSTTSGTSHSDFRSGGVTVGIIKRFDEAFSVGFAGGYTRSNISVENPSATLGIDSYHALLHGTWDTNAFRLNGLVGYAVQQFDGSRSVAGGSAAASYGGGSVRAGLDGGYKIKWNQHEFMPFAGLDVIHGWTAGYTETGAPGGLNLTYDAASSNTVDGRLGLKWSTRHTVSPNVRIEPMVSAAWVHSFGDSTPKVHGSMFGNSFVLTGASRSREALAVAAGLSSDIGDNLSIFGRYSGRLASDVSAHDFSAGLRYKW